MLLKSVLDILISIVCKYIAPPGGVFEIIMIIIITIIIIIISIGYTTRWRSLRHIHYRGPQARGCVYRRDRHRVV